MFREKLAEHGDRVTALLKDFPQIATIEASTKSSLIEPFLRCLGYDTSHPQQVSREVLTELGGRIDYLLTGQTNVKIAVEAKKAGTTLSVKEINQLRSYFTFSEAAAGVLTNGVEVWLFTDLDKANVMDAEPFLMVDARIVTENDIVHLEALTRNRVKKSAIHKLARRERHRRLVNKIVSDELQSPSQEFLKLIGKKAGIKPLTKPNMDSLAPLVDEALSRHRHANPPVDHMPKLPTSDGPSETAPPDPGLSPSEKAARTLERFQGANLFGESLECVNYTQMLKEVVKALQRQHRHDFAQRVRREPFFKENRKRQYISISKSDFQPGDFLAKVGEYYVFAHLNARNKVKRARLFLSEFGYDPNQLVVHTSE